MSTSDRLLGIFAKYWQPGAAKTRLGQEIGVERASSLSRVFLLTLLQRFRWVEAEKELCFWPPEREAEFTDLAGETWRTRPQIDGHLGQRMQHFFESARQRGARQIVLIGSDTPNLPVAFVEQAFASLDESPIVLGPSMDGGYYLIGLAEILPPIFDQLPWSTPHLWSQTVERLAHSRLPYVQLPAWYDVDVASDLRRLRGDLIDADQPELVALRTTLEEIVGN